MPVGTLLLRRQKNEKMPKEPIFWHMHRMLREVVVMKYYYVTFRSVTHGQRGEKMLKQQGIRCHLLRTPKWMEAKGCGYSLQLWTRDAARAVQLLRQEKVPMQKIYIQTGDGTLEEVEL